jgi:uncharacterized protein YndB with AHSA1/START domain
VQNNEILSPLTVLFVPAKIMHRRKIMIKNKIQVQINRPVETVFAFVVEPANTVQWLDVVSEAGKTSEGELGVGSVYRQLFKLRGETNQEMFFEITVFEPNQSMAFRRKGGQYPISGVYTFEANGDGTLLTVFLTFTAWMRSTSGKSAGNCSVRIPSSPMGRTGLNISPVRNL